MAGLDGGYGEEAEGVGIEAVELVLVTEARENGLGARERGECVLEGELGD